MQMTQRYFKVLRRPLSRFDHGLAGGLEVGGDRRKLIAITRLQVVLHVNGEREVVDQVGDFSRMFSLVGFDSLNQPLHLLIDALHLGDQRHDAQRRLRHLLDNFCRLRRRRFGGAAR